MRQFVMAAVAAVSLGTTGAALADSPILHHTVGVEQAGNSVVLPSEHPQYLATNDGKDVPGHNDDYLKST
jgi:hypothetical protein